MLANHKGEIPVVILLLPFIAGIIIGVNFAGINVIYPGAIFAGLTILFFLFNVKYNRFGLYKASWIGGLLINLSLLALGCTVAVQNNELNSNIHFSKQQPQLILGYINSEPQTKNDITRFTLNVTGTKKGNRLSEANGNLLVSIKDAKAHNLTYGQQLVFAANYSTPAPPYNPGEFNYKRYLANKNIYCQIFLYPGQYALLNQTKGNKLVAAALNMRQVLIKKLQANIRDTNAVAVASTLILGYKADLSDDILQAYSKTGTIHILSVSGGHVAIIYLMLSWLLGFLNRFKYGRLIRAICILLLIWAYAVLTGLSPAACRAALMLSLIVTGKTYSRYINTLNLLAVSAFVLLMYDPLLLYDVGFQLSYLAVAGLVIFQPIIYKWFSFDNKWISNIWLACSVSLAATAITFPLSAYYFHQFPVYFLLSNLIIAIPVTVILYAGILLLLLPQIAWVSQALGFLLEQCILFTNKTLGFIEHASFASVSGLWLTAAEYLLLFAVVVLLFYLAFSKKSWPLKAALIYMLFFSLSFSYHKYKADNNRSIVFLNMRKNIGIIFKDGRRGVVISNLPPTDKNFKYSVQPCLDSMQIADYKVYTPAANITLPYLIKRGELLQFGNKKILLLNRSSKIESIPPNLKSDYIYLTDNGYIPETKTPIITDGSNSNKHIEMIKNTFSHYYILKRNKSLIVQSKR
ncbi:ComEC/Rec2 family competence protein [Mucilaginibacter pallidiroseus]|uniref:ComEC/Rec2 family competence protein n=1 Tax=Mucilaginibacter pallidiroseus TaxID=2599295 RepID=A0A563UHY0_9SPHI|nr:ComEC/Rec2 family competence protein [Mucilaginibacter pallidiroseus]TWR31010.1 ComEC/Rec2 family competence protein [Mucilaginibacter pallidiroseus]